MAGRKSPGRQKIPLEKIHNPNNLNVTFSKCRVGLFKKAHELGVMCGVQVGLICFSPAGKVFSYGCPNLAHVLNKFATDGSSAIPNDQLIMELNTQLGQIQNQLEVGRKLGEEHDKHRESRLSSSWWRGENANQIGLEAIQKLIVAMENIKRYVAQEAAKLQAMKPAPASNVAANFPFDLYGYYAKNGGEDPFVVGTSSAASSSGNHRGGNDNGSGSF